MKPITIPNAPWWLNHSHVLTKGRMTAGDSAAITNGITGTETVNGVPTIVMKPGDQNILKVRRMITQGVVAVLLDDGEKHEVKLPDQVEDLLDADLTYICSQIDARGKPMNAEELQRFLASANGHSEAHSPQTSLSPVIS